MCKTRSRCYQLLSQSSKMDPLCVRLEHNGGEDHQASPGVHALGRMFEEAQGKGHGSTKENMVHKIVGVCSLALFLICPEQSVCAAIAAFGLADTPCEAYVSEYEASVHYGDVYVERVNTAMRLAWIAGFLSAIKAHILQDKELFSHGDQEHIKLWIRDYCTKHPTTTLLEAANALYEELKQRR
jgi:hypothetical protein